MQYTICIVLYNMHYHIMNYATCIQQHALCNMKDKACKIQGSIFNKHHAIQQHALFHYAIYHMYCKERNLFPRHGLENSGYS